MYAYRSEYDQSRNADDYVGSGDNLANADQEKCGSRFSLIFCHRDTQVRQRLEPGFSSRGDDLTTENFTEDAFQSLPKP